MSIALTLSPDQTQAILTNADLTLYFDRRFGGAPLRWLNGSNVDLVSTFPGEACNVVYDTGNDGTQASSDGLTQNTISRMFVTAYDKYAYYLGERLLETSSLATVEAGYSVDGLIPFFWASLEAIDDCIPTDPRGPNGWNTQYNNFLGLPPSTFSSPGVPLIFARRGPVTSGMILIGDEIKQTYSPGTPWNQAYTKIHAGNFACRFKVSLLNASSDAIAGLIIRKQVPVGTANINTLYAANGYQLNFNKQGTVQLVRNNTTVIWTSPKNYGPILNTSTGLSVEVRTHKDDNTKIDIYLNDVFVNTATLNYTYEAFGFFAACLTGKITFTYREFFDCNVLMKTTWNAANGYIQSTLGLYCLTTTPMYRTNLPVLFMTPALRQWWEVKDFDDHVWTMHDTIPWAIAPGLLPTDHIKSVWIGTEEGAGIGMQIESDMLDGHIGISPTAVAFNILPYSANTSPVDVNTVEVVLKYKSSRW